MKVTKRVVFEVNHNDLDKAITEFLKSKGIKCEYYECVAYEEWCNDQSHSFNVTGKESEYEFNLEDIRNREFSYGTTRSILNWMCAEKVIEPGEYLIDVSW